MARKNSSVGKTYKFNSKSQRMEQVDSAGNFVSDGSKALGPPLNPLPLVPSTPVPVEPTPSRTLPTLLTPNQITLTWQCYAKMIALRDSCPSTEVGWHFLSDPATPFRFVDIIVPIQKVSAASVDFDVEAKSDLLVEMHGKGIAPSRWLPWWGHSHPGEGATPSNTDWETFDTTYTQPQVALMFIIGKGEKGEVFINFRLNSPPYTVAFGPVKLIVESSPLQLAQEAFSKAYTSPARAEAHLSLSKCHEEVSKFYTEILLPWLIEIGPRIRTTSYSYSQSSPTPSTFRGDAVTPYHLDGETAHQWHRRQRSKIERTLGVAYGEWKWSDAARNKLGGWVHESGAVCEYFHNIRNPSDLPYHLRPPASIPTLPPLSASEVIEMEKKEKENNPQAKNISFHVEVADALVEFSPPHKGTEEQTNFEFYLKEYEAMDNDDQALVSGLIRDRHHYSFNGTEFLFTGES